MVGILPVGTLVRLDTGGTGLVVDQTCDPLPPHALLLETLDGAEKEGASLFETEQGRYQLQQQVPSTRIKPASTSAGTIHDCGRSPTAYSFILLTNKAFSCILMRAIMQLIAMKALDDDRIFSSDAGLRSIGGVEV